MPDLSFLDELERLAKAASPGPWLVDHDDRLGYEWNMHIVLGDFPNRRICFMTSDGKPETAEYIATANPLAILSLIAALREAEGRVAIAEQALSFLRSRLNDSRSNGDRGIRRHSGTFRMTRLLGLLIGYACAGAIMTGLMAGYGFCM